MKGHRSFINEQIVVDGLVLDALKPFEVYQCFPRNDSLKSTASTKILANQDPQQLELKDEYKKLKRLFLESGTNNFQEIYVTMLKIRATNQLLEYRQRQPEPNNNISTIICNKHKIKCKQTRKKLYLNQFQAFRYQRST